MSEFGKGFTYCLALFLAHQHMYKLDGKVRIIPIASLWFNASSDHLYDLQIPNNFVLKDECQKWADQMIKYGHGSKALLDESLTKEDVYKALTECKKFLMAWDKQCGIEVEKGDYE